MADERRARIVAGLSAITALAAAVNAIAPSLAVRRTPLTWCSFPQLHGASCVGTAAVLLAAVATVAAVASVLRRPRSGIAVAGLLVGVLVGAVLVAAGSTLSVALLGSAAAGLGAALRARPPDQLRRLARPGSPAWRIGGHLAVGIAGLGATLALWEPVWTTPTSVCGLFVTGGVPLLVSYPCYPLWFLSLPGVVGLASVGTAWAIAEELRVPVPLEASLGGLAFVSGLLVLHQSASFTVPSGLALVFAGGLALGLAVVPDPTGASETV